MSDIKSGDLVMVVKLKACCGTGRPGQIFTARTTPFRATGVCERCGNAATELFIYVDEGDDWHVLERARIKKIDPPAKGDSLPTRRDLEVTV